MALFDSLTDDQLALIGCVVALAVAFAFMSLTWTVRQSARPAQSAASILEAARLRKQQLHETRERRAA